MNDAQDDVSRSEATDGEIRDAVVFQDVSDFSLNLTDVYRRFLNAGIERSLRTLQRYCDHGHLDAKKYPSELGDVWYVNPESVAVKIEEIRQIQSVKERRPATSSDSDDREFPDDKPVTVEPSNDDEQRQENYDAVRRSEKTKPESALQSDRQSVSEDDNNYVTVPVAVLDALTEQLRVKDEQIERRDDELSKLTTARDDDQKFLHSMIALIHDVEFELPAANPTINSPAVSATERKPIERGESRPPLRTEHVENRTTGEVPR